MKSRVDDEPRLDEKRASQKRGDGAERNVDGGRDDGEFARPQQHHGPGLLAKKTPGQFAEKFRMGPYGRKPAR